MHMSDALLSPAVGGTFWAGTAAAVGWCSRKVGRRIDDRTVPLMGVAAAFVFAAQMINFSIPGTGSSGHLGGGLILAALLGPHAAFLAMASVLTVQALFFADGGLLALGCNIWNLGVYPCFVAFPLLFRPLARSGSTSRITLASAAAAVGGLQFGAFSVVLQTLFSGRSELPFAPFLLLMLPIHLAIGLVEGFATAGVLRYVGAVRPEILAWAEEGRPRPSRKRVLLLLGLLAALSGGFLSWFSSTDPDGLEWSISRLAGKAGPAETSGGTGEALKTLQEKTAILPGYGFRPSGEPGRETPSALPPGRSAPVPAGPDAGKTVSGLVGSGIVLLLTVLVGGTIRRFRKRTSARAPG